MPQTRRRMRLRHRDHHRFGRNAGPGSDLGANPLAVVAGDDRQIQHHHYHALPTCSKGDGLGVERVHNRLGRAMLAGAATRQMRARRRRDIDHRGSGV